MNTHFSLLALYARSTIARLLAVLTLSAVAEAGLFFLASSPELPLEQVLAGMHLGQALMIAFFLWTTVLTMPDLLGGRYTLDRLRVSPRAVLLCRIGYNALCFLLFWCFQVCLLMGLFLLYARSADPAVFGPQNLMLAAYRVPLLHSLLPLADWTLYLRNVLLALAMGAATAFPFVRRDLTPVTFLPAAAAALGLVFSFIRSPRNWSADLIVMGVCLIVIASVAFCQPRTEPSGAPQEEEVTGDAS